MFKELRQYLKTYLRIAEPNPWLFAINFISAVLYKVADIARPFIAALIIKALTENNAEETYFYIVLFTAVYLFLRGMLFFNWRTDSWNATSVYCHIHDKIFNKVISVDHKFSKKKMKIDRTKKRGRQVFHSPPSLMQVSVSHSS